jgi:hypothetical protein
MTAPPLPASPCVKVDMDYTATDGYLASNRFFLSYSGASPTSGNCASLASDIANAWNTNLAPQISALFVLTGIDVIDIASDTGSSGQASPNDPGTASGTPLPAQCATNVEFGIARRYRGGKPRIYLPPPAGGVTLDQGHYDPSFIDATNTAVTGFFSTIAALSIGAMGTLAHVNLSYYKGFTNITNSSGRERAVPSYRDAALVDPVNGYFTKGLIGSQRRRRNSTTF